MSQTQNCEWYKRFKDGGNSIKGYLRFGRPSTLKD